MDEVVTIKARQCPYDPKVWLGFPIGQFHCEVCGCMVVAGLDHGICLPGLCPALNVDGSNAEGWEHPGELTDYELTKEAAVMLGLINE